jgi:hypothetical protein
LQENYVEEKGSLVLFDGLYKHYVVDNEDVALCETVVGKMIHCLFSTFQSTHLQANKIRRKFYIGLKRRDLKTEISVDDNEPLTLEQIPLKMCLAPYFIISSTSDKLFIGTFANHTIDGMRVFKEICFCHQTKTWMLKVCGLYVDCRIIGLNEKMSWTTNNISTILKTVQNCKICTGSKMLTSEHTYASSKFHKNKWQNGADCEIRVRSHKCRGILTYQNTSGTCRTCLLTCGRAAAMKDNPALDKENIPPITGHPQPHSTPCTPSTRPQPTPQPTPQPDLKTLFPGNYMYD